jgi:hypothetical protein
LDRNGLHCLIKATCMPLVCHQIDRKNPILS